jgi:hypothetical protein
LLPLLPAYLTPHQLEGNEVLVSSYITDLKK